MTCKVNNVKVTGAAGATKSDTKIVAIGSMVGCNPDVGYGFELSKENTVTESKSITVGNSKTFEWGHEVSVTAGKNTTLQITLSLKLAASHMQLSQDRP